MADVIGVIGAGFVGSAIIQFFNERATVRVYDVNPDIRSVDSVHDAVIDSRVTFVAVPTPMKPDGSCDTTFVEDVLQNIVSVATEVGIRPLVLLKSTVPPGVTRYLHLLYGEHIDIVFNPEFLTEARAAQDFAEQNRILLGGESNIMSAMAFYYEYFPNVPVFMGTFEEIELVKYVTNAYLALKVAFANEIFQFAQAASIDYDRLLPMLTADPRLGTTHWKVPGPDGKFGFGGSCFPKDVNGLLHRALTEGVNLSILRAAWERNLQLRPDKDWEYLKGRAVV